MKKQLISCVTAFCMAAGCSITASANELHDRYDEWRAAALDDSGMFRGFRTFAHIPDSDYFLAPYELIDSTELGLEESIPYGTGGTFTFCAPKDDYGLVVLKSADCYDQFYDIFASCFPFNEAAENPGSTGKITTDKVPMENAYWIQNISQDNSVWEKFGQKLSDAEIISEFYSPDHVWEEKMFLHVPYLTCYTEDISPMMPYAAQFDAEAVEEYIEAENLACTLQARVMPRINQTWYYVVPNEQVTAAEHMALARQLYGALGIIPYADPAPVSFFGALAVSERTHAEEFADLFPEKKPLAVSDGDLDLNGKINVSDAVLMARLAAGDSTLVLNNSARAAADLNHDGMFTADDLAILLKLIVGA